MKCILHFWPTCLSVGAVTDERRNTVDARGARGARSCSAVVDVFRAVGSNPAINAHTDIAAKQVAAGTSILASVWLQTTLVHIFSTVLTCGEAGREDKKRRKYKQLQLNRKVNTPCYTPT